MTEKFKQELNERRKNRRKFYGEDFTPLELVNEMLSKLPNEVWEPEKLWIDPAGGNGNFVVEVLKRKLEKGHEPLQALLTIFSIEILQDNVDEMKSRLLSALPDLDDTQRAKAIGILNHNIVCADALTWDYENWCPLHKTAKPLF